MGAALGYESTGFRGKGLHGTTAEVYQDRAFNSDGSLTHVFCRDCIGATAAYPLEWTHDISFWTLESFCEEERLKITSEACGLQVESALVLLDQYVSPKDGKREEACRTGVGEPIHDVVGDDESEAVG